MEKLQIRRFQRPHPSLKTLLQETPSNICKRLILPETRVIDLHFATDGMGLCVLVFTQLSLKAKPPESKTFGTKTEFGVKFIATHGHSLCNHLQADKG